jgi:hypothetical protein
VNRKNRAGLWLSVTTLVLGAVLMLVAYYFVNSAPASAASVAQQDPLDAENGCWDCHEMPNLADTDWYYIDWYCHNALPAESYSSRRYLRAHLDWVISYLTIPPELYMPATQLSPNESRINLFDRKMFPSLATITIGTKVTWTNKDIRDYILQSPLTSQQWPFESVTLRPGESISYTFEQAGVFPYTYQYAEMRPVTTPLYQSVLGKIVVSGPK